jgi:glucokinase
MSNYIALDIGGTQTRLALFHPNNQVPVFTERIATQKKGELPLQRLLNLIETVWEKCQPVAAIGAAAASPVDPYRGIVIAAPNILNWVNLPLQQHIEERFHVPTAIGNDANLAALAEWKFGSGIGHRNMIYITVSTGIGGGVILDNKLLLGERGLAGELGHITVLPDGPLCGCGQRGHLEAVASGPSIARWVEGELLQGKPSLLNPGVPLTAKEVGAAAAKGDALAVAAFQRAGTFLGRAFADYLHIFNVTAFVVGGSVTRVGPLLFDPLNATLRASVMSPYFLENLIVTTASLGDEVGLMGALALAQGLTEK